MIVDVVWTYWQLTWVVVRCMQWRYTEHFYSASLRPLFVPSSHPIPLRVSLSISSLPRPFGAMPDARCPMWDVMRGMNWKKYCWFFYFWISSYMGPKSNKLISLEGASKQVSKKWTVTVSFHLFFVVWRKRTVLTISIGELMSYISLHLLYSSGLSLIKRLTTQSPKVSLCHCSWPEFFEGDCCRSFDVNWSNNLIKLFLMKISEDQPKQDLLQEEDAEGALRCHFRRASRSYELPSLKGVADEIQGTFTKPYLFFLLRKLA